MSISLPPALSAPFLAKQREDALKSLSPEAAQQREMGGFIISGLLEGKQVTAQISAFNPTAIPLALNPYYYLEIAIKLGDLEAVKALFNRYAEKRSNYKEEMRQSILMEHPYRPIFWLGAVCDPHKPQKMGAPAPNLTSYVKIVEFMEEKLDISASYQHPTPKGLINKTEYISLFCKDEQKKSLFGIKY